jgi:hypothetical protein
MAKKPLTHEELKDQLDQADLAEQQLESQALIEGAEKSDIARYTEGRDLVNQMLGQARMARAMSKFTDVVNLQTLQHIKENKLYQHLKGVSMPDPRGNEIPNVGSWAGFCKMLGTTASKIDEDLLNLRVLGEDAMESLKSIGAGYRDLRKLRQLPEEERELIVQGEVVKVDDKETLVDLIEEMAARHAKEKEGLKQQAETSRQELEASRRVTQDKSSRIAELEEQLHRRQTMSPDQRVDDYSRRLEAAGLRARSALLEPRSVMVEILDWQDAPRELRHACAQQVARLRIELDQLQIELGLEPVDLDVDDSWMEEVQQS